jgi:hypothetical protein
MMAVRNEVMVQTKLYDKDGSSISQQSMEYPHNSKPAVSNKPANNKNADPPKMINDDSTMPHKYEMDAMSIASVKTTNTQSKLIDSRNFKYDEFTEKHNVDNADTDSQISQNNVMVKANIKNSGRIFVPTKKHSEDYTLPEGSETVNVKILASNNREITKKITVSPVLETPNDENYILANTKDGQTLILPLDVDALAKQINEEVDPSQDLHWSLRCYIIEIIQKAIYNNNLFT